MKVRFDWQVADDDQWETIAQETPQSWVMSLRRVPNWARYTLLIALAALALASALTVRQRYREAQLRVSFQIQSVIDLEARAYAKGDVDQFMRQQDAASGSWYAHQERRVQHDCGRAPPGGETSTGPCAPVLHAELVHLELRGDMAWVEVMEDSPTVRRVRFYRQTERGWVRTAPRESFWGDVIELQSGMLFASYHERDEPHVSPYLDRIQALTTDLCGTLDCQPEDTLAVRFVAEPSELNRAGTSSDQARREDALLLASPWLAGIRPDGALPTAELNYLEYQAAYAIAARAVRSSAASGLNRLQELVLLEYASWYSTQDIGQAPILGRIVERHGARVLPDVLRSARQSRTLSSVMARWLALSADDSQLEYFETLLNVERDALQVGQRETFLQLQDRDYAWWIADQERLFELGRSRPSVISSPAIRARRVERIGRRARVVLQDPSRSFEGYPPAAKTVVYYEYVDGDWKHASPFAAAMFWAFLAERRPAGTVTPPLTPTPVPSPF